MERIETRIEGTRSDGSKIVRNFFINPEPKNLLVKAQSYFTREEKKVAKANHKRFGDGK